MRRARWIGLLAVALFASGLLCWSLPSSVAAVLVVVWLHVAVGALVCAGLVVYVPLHLRRVAKTRSPASRVTGWALCGVAAAVTLSGVATALPETALGELGVVAARGSHFAVAAGLLVLLWVHRVFAPKDMLGGAEIAVTLALLLGAVGVSAAMIQRDAGVFAEARGEPVDPASALRVAAASPAVSTLADTARCEACHPAIVAQWESSAHRFASFANPFYLHALQTLDELRGREATKFCAACHDPLPLQAGVFDTAEALTSELPLADRGVTCLVCHNAVHAGDGTGNGDLTLARAAPLWPGDLSPAPRGGLAGILVRARPDAHVARVSPAALRTSALCGTCHEVGLPTEVTGFRFLPGFNDFDDWQRSPFSHEVALPLGRADEESCLSCHMPRVPAEDPAARGGTVLDHRFAAANLALAQHVGDDEWRARAREGLQAAGASALPISVSTEGEFRGILYGEVTALPTARELLVHTLVSATGVGHDFPGGTADSHEVWVELEVTDADGRVLAHHGRPVEDGGPPPDAHLLRARLLDERGEPIVARDAFRSRTVLYRHLAPAGAGELVRHAFTLPASARGPVVITTRLWFRKFSREFVAAVYQRRGEPAPAQERQLLSEASSQVRLGARVEVGGCLSPEADAERWSYVLRFISAATRVGEYALALAAAERALACGVGAPARVKKARTLLASRRPAEALRELGPLLEDQPERAGLQMIAANAEAAMGEDESALQRLRALAGRFPRDRALHHLRARLALRSAAPEEALAAAEAALAVEPRDVEACYQRMLAASSLGRARIEQEARACYEAYREDEAQRALRRRRRAADPRDDLEAEPRHIHHAQRGAP